MKNLKDAKDIYDHIVVPEELDLRLREALDSAKQKKNSKNEFLRFTKYAGAIAASFLLCFTIGLNTSQSFAMEMSNLPFIGQIAKVLTIRSYKTTKDTTTTKVEVPEVQLETADQNTTDAITDVNKKIQLLVDDYTTQKELEIAEHKEAFFSSGGTLEEWEARSIDVNVSYEIKFQNDAYLSLMIDSWISWFNFEEERHVYNIDLATGKELTLVDFLGPDAYTYATDCVLQQMEALIAQDPEQYLFWGINESGSPTGQFIGVTENTLFYLNEDGNIVISYDKYEVSPGSMGIQEFVIPTK